MKKLLFFCSLAVMLSSTVAFTAKAPDATVVLQDFPSTPEGWAEYYEARMKRCAKEAYAWNLELQAMRESIEGGNLMHLLRVEYVTDQYKSACWRYHWYRQNMLETRAKLAKPTPTPTPTPTATPILTTPSGSGTSRPTPGTSGTETIPLWPDDNELHKEFIAEQIKKLRELKELREKLIKEIEANLEWAKANPPKEPKSGPKVEIIPAGGILILSFTTPQGVVRTCLPNDIRAGDKISSTTTLVPTGKTPAERTRNEKALENLSLKLLPFRPVMTEGEGNVPAPIETIDLIAGPAQTHKIVVPENLSTEAVNCQIITKDGKTVGEGAVAVGPKQAGTSQTASSGIEVPTNIQNQRYLEIKHQSDGDATNTQVTVSGQPVKAQTETPRATVVEIPTSLIGAVEIKLKENNVENSGVCLVIGVQLTAPKTSLLRGEKTVVTIEVSGLQGIKKSVPLHLEAGGVIDMEGGNYQYLEIQPSEVKSGGRYTTTRTITAQQAGGFTVTATVLDATRIPIINEED